MIRTKRFIVEAFVLATVITAALITITLLGGGSIHPVETAAVYLSFACTWLCTRQVRFNYVLAVASTSLLAVTFFEAGLYASMLLNIYLIPTVIYGWFVWGKDTSPRPVEHVRPRNLLIYVAVTAAVWVGAVVVVAAAGGVMAPLDSWLLVGTVLAQFLMDRKKLENWVVWTAVNVVSIYVYFTAGLYLLAGQFVLFLANSIFAWFAWRKTMQVP